MPSVLRAIAAAILMPDCVRLGITLTPSVASYAYDGVGTPAAFSVEEGPAQGSELGRWLHEAERDVLTRNYDDPVNLARASARPDVYRLAPNTAGLVDDVVSSSRWSRTSFGGNRVYQRNDLIDPALVDRPQHLWPTEPQSDEPGNSPVPAPRGITRIDTPKVAGEQVHATFDGGAALNIDGTWKHGFVDLTRAQRDWLRANGWNV